MGGPAASPDGDGRLRLGSRGGTGVRVVRPGDGRCRALDAGHHGGDFRDGIRVLRTRHDRPRPRDREHRAPSAGERSLEPVPELGADPRACAVGTAWWPRLGPDGSSPSTPRASSPAPGSCSRCACRRRRVRTPPLRRGPCGGLARGRLARVAPAEPRRVRRDQLLAGGVSVLGPVVAKEELGGAGDWGAVLTGGAVGAVVGSAIAIRLDTERPLLWVFGGTIPVAFMVGSLAPPLHTGNRDRHRDSAGARSRSAPPPGRRRSSSTCRSTSCRG